jgi:hypothetical protein
LKFMVFLAFLHSIIFWTKSLAGRRNLVIDIRRNYSIVN